MNLLFKNLYRAIILSGIGLLWTMNPETAQLQSLLHLALQCLHNSTTQGAFAALWLTLCGLDLACGVSTAVVVRANAVQAASGTRRV